MKPSGKGYDLPYAVDRGVRIGSILVLSVCAVGCAVLLAGMITPVTLLDWVFVLAPALLMLVLMWFHILELLAVVHIVPEGIAITVLGRTLRQFPAEKIRFLTAVPGNAASDRVNRIAVCHQTLEELTELGRKSTPRIMQIREPRWQGEFAGQYLYHRSMTVPGETNFMRKILWLDWDPERLALLREMYPKAQWLDCTRDKRFEKQLER